MPVHSATAGARHLPKRTRRSGRTPVPVLAAIAGASSAPMLKDENEQSQADEHERQAGGEVPVERALIVDINDTRKGVELQERYCSKVAEGVQSDEESTGRDGRPELGESHAPERRPTTLAEAARGFFEGVVHALQCRAYNHEYVGIRKQG